MGIFQRAHDIAQAKANKALDAAEKPDEMLDLSYQKMLEQITQVRRALVDLAGSRKNIELQEQQFQHTIDHLQDQAKAALGQGREDLAKEALSRKAAAQQQIDDMEPQRIQMTEEEQKLTKTLDALQKRVNEFRTQKETLKAQYTAAKAITSVNESTAGISKSFNDSGASLQRAQDKIATMQARSGALDELLESGVLEDVGGGGDDIQKELDQVGKDASVDSELAALKAQLAAPAPPAPDALSAAPAATPGTTRDLVTERISLDGIPLELVDTADLGAHLRSSAGGWPEPYRALSSDFRSLPVSVLGSSLTKCTLRGALKLAILDFTNAMISCSSSGPGTAPAAGWTKAATDSPISGSAIPITATS